MAKSVVTPLSTDPPDADPGRDAVVSALSALIATGGPARAPAQAVAGAMQTVLDRTAASLGARAATLLVHRPSDGWQPHMTTQGPVRDDRVWDGEALAALLEAAQPDSAPMLLLKGRGPPAAAKVLAGRDCDGLLLVPATAYGESASAVACDLDAGAAGRAGCADGALLQLVAQTLAAHLPPCPAAALLRADTAQGPRPLQLPDDLGPPDLVIRIDAEGRFSKIATEDDSLLPAPRAAILGRRPEEVLPADLQALCRQALAGAEVVGRCGPLRYRLDLPSGRRRFAVTALRADDPAGGFALQIHDVTGRYGLLQDADGLRHVIERMTDLVIVTDPQRRIAWVNPAFEARTGWRLDEIAGRRAGDLLNAPETDPRTLKLLQDAPLGGQLSDVEVLNRARDGTRFWTRVNVQTLQDEDGEIAGFVTIEKDITDQKQQDAELARLAAEATEARARLEMAVEALPDGFAYYDADERLVLCNTPYRRLYPGLADKMVPGVSLEEVLRHGIANGSFPAAVGREDAFVQERLASHRAGANMHETQLTGGRWLRVIERPTPDGGRAGMRIDITQIKQTEQRLAGIIEGAEVGTWEWTVPTGQNLINARWAGMLGYRLDELEPVGIEVWERLCHPEDLAVALAMLDQVFERQLERFEYELRMRHKAGHWVWVQSHGRVVRWAPDGKPEVMAGVHLDITALKQAESRLEGVIRGAEAGTWQVDLRSGTQQINDRWAEMLGYTRAELEPMSAQRFTELLHPEDLRLERHLGQKKGENDGERFEGEFRMRHRDGHWVWVLSRGHVVVRDAEGAPEAMAGIHLDITERKRLEAELEAERDTLARLMETSASGIVAMDDKGRIVFANREAEVLLGVQPGRLAGMPVRSRIWQVTDLQGRPVPEQDMPFSRVMAFGQPVRDFRHAVLAPDGTRRSLSVNAAPVASGQGAARVVCTITDISVQVAAEAELQAALARAEEANRAKSLFLANMSHEIRTPLNGVLGMTEVLGETLDAPEHRRMIDTIRDSGEMLLSVLNDVLDMTKIEAGKLELERVAFRPTDLAQRIEAIHGPAAREKGLALSVESGPGMAAPRVGDPHRLLQVLHNLVGNALKFTHTGRVTVRLRNGPGDALWAEITDTGIGMTEAQLGRVFDEFAQADDSVTRRYGGTGLGMAIVRRLVDLMGGTIRIDSRPGQGTTVRVELALPLAQPDPAVARPEREADEGTARPHPLAGRRVLAADDVATNRLILKAMLGSLGIAVDMVDNGRQAVDRATAEPFDLLLLDISMPELDGISALAEIRAAAQAQGTPAPVAVAITANAMSHQISEYLAAGFAAHIGKPFRREDLDRTLRALDLPSV